MLEVRGCAFGRVSTAGSVTSRDHHDSCYSGRWDSESKRGQRLALPFSPTTREWEPVGKTWRDFKNSIRAFCSSAERVLKAFR
jgi:hypothetical protein